MSTQFTVATFIENGLLLSSLWFLAYPNSRSQQTAIATENRDKFRGFLDITFPNEISVKEYCLNFQNLSIKLDFIAVNGASFLINNFVTDKS